MTLSKKALPPVSREFVLELKKVFRPMEVTPGFDRDELMQSVGEQRVINWMLRRSNHPSIQSTLDITKDNTNDNTTITNRDNSNNISTEVSPEVTPKYKWWEMFTTRFGNHA